MIMKIYLTIVFIMLVFASATFAQPIRHETLKDGVERWYRVKAAGDKPWFFQQVENLFNVILPPKDKLPFGESVAFLVGVSKYDHLKQQLPFVENDLEDVRTFLLSSGGFDTVYVASEKIVNRDLIEDYVRNKFAKWLDKRDRFLFYYSGHGDDSGGKTGYMQFASAHPNNFAGPQVLAINDAGDWSSEMPQNHLLFIFDCCASGLAFGAPKGAAGAAYTQMIETLSRNGSRAVMTAGTAEEMTYEVKTAGGRGNGVFTRAFLNAAATGLADKGSDGFMTVDEIFARIKDEVAGFAAKSKLGLTPRLWPLQAARFRGTFVFVNPEAQRRKIALPDDYAQKFSARPRGEVVAEFGFIRLAAMLTGSVTIDGRDVGNLVAGEIRDYPALVGRRKIEVRSNDETVSGTVAVKKGQTAPITLRATKPAEVVTKQPDLKSSRPTPRYTLRSTPKSNLSIDEVKTMLKDNNYYCSDAWGWDWSNPNGQGIPNQYELQQSGRVVYDVATGLYWQQSGSSNYMTYADALKHVEQLRRDRYAGYDDWRLPTLEEAMSLMEREKSSNGLYIDAKFDKTQSWIWTSDKYPASRAWVVSFHSGDCNHVSMVIDIYVRAVR
jgi:hypothetical protein